MIASDRSRVYYTDGLGFEHVRLCALCNTLAGTCSLVGSQLFALGSSVAVVAT